MPPRGRPAAAKPRAAARSEPRRNLVRHRGGLDRRATPRGGMPRLPNAARRSTRAASARHTDEMVTERPGLPSRDDDRACRCAASPQVHNELVEFPVPPVASLRPGVNDEDEHRPRVLRIEPTIPRFEEPVDQHGIRLTLDEQFVTPRCVAGAVSVGDCEGSPSGAVSIAST